MLASLQRYSRYTVRYIVRVTGSTKINGQYYHSGVINKIYLLVAVMLHLRYIGQLLIWSRQKYYTFCIVVYFISYLYITINLTTIFRSNKSPINIKNVM